jgi:hypothetical protein
MDSRTCERLAAEQKGEVVANRGSASVAQRTAGILAKYRLGKSLSPEEERAAFEEAVAHEVGDDYRDTPTEEGGPIPG